MEENQDESAAAPGWSARASAAAPFEPTQQTLADISNDKTAAFIVSYGTLIATFSNPFTFPLGVAAIVLGTLIPIYWPTDNSTQVWESIAEKVSLSIDQKLEEDAIDRAIGYAKKMRDRCLELKTSLDRWLKTGEGADHIRNQYSALLGSYVPDMNDLASDKYKGIIVAQYVNAAMNYLSLLRGLYPYADNLLLGGRNNSTVGKPHVLERIKNDTAKLVNEAITSYRFGLKNVHGKPSSTWENYNAYRAISTYSALDFLAVFPYFNPEIYPSAVSIRCLNRKILLFHDTSLRRNPNDAINNIDAFETRINTSPRAPLKLKELEFTYGQHIEQRILPGSPWIVYQSVFDGVTQIACTTTTTDGKAETVTLTAPRIQDNFEPRQTKLSDIYAIPFFFATYWSDNAADKRPRKTIKQFLFYVFSGTSGQSHGQRQFLFNRSNYFAHREIYASIPALPRPVQKFPDKSFYSETLEELRMLNFHRIDTTDAALLSVWHHNSIEEHMRPLVNHALTAAQDTAVEQFHAIRAYTAIQKQGLRIVPGPGFTGGDLVAIKLGQYIEFMVINNQTNWFAGFYWVRLWFLRSASLRTIDITTTPSNNLLSSILTASIPAQGNANTVNPSHEDLVSFTFPHRVLLVNSMPDFTLRLDNATQSGAELILDRIELIKESHATI